MQLPKSFANEKLKKREFSFRGNGNMLALRYHDKKEIYMLSTMHKAGTVNVRRRNWREDNIIQKPKVIDDYNQKMRGVDKNEAIIGNYSCIRKSYKWYIKIFFDCLEEAVFNAFIIYKNYHPQPKYPSRYKASSRHLRIVLELSCLDKTFLRHLQDLFT